MTDKPYGLLFIVVILSIFIGLEWLTYLVLAAGFFMLLTEIKIRPKPVAVPAGGSPKKEEILTPVIVQDVGEAPYLYPPDFRMKIKTDWGANNAFEWAASGGVFAARSIRNLARGQPLAMRRHVPEKLW